MVAGHARELESPKPRLSFFSRLLVIVGALYVGAIPLEAYAAFSGRSYTFLLGGLVLAAWAMSTASDSLSRRVPYRFNYRESRPLWISLVLFALWMILTTAWSPDTAISISRLATMLGLALLVPALARSFALSGSDLFARLFLATSCVLAMLTVTKIDGSTQVSVGDLNQNDEAFYLCIAACWATWFLFRAKGRYQVLYLLVIVVAVVGALGTGSRTGATVLLVVLPIVMLISSGTSQALLKSVLWFICLSGLLLVSFLLASSLLPARVLQLSDSFRAGDTWSGRTRLWSGAMALRDQWLWAGEGLGYSRYFVGTYYEKNQVLHNTYLSIAVELGIIGLILFVAVFVSTLLVVRKSRNAGLFLVAFLPAILFMWTLSLEYEKLVWVLPAIVAGGIALKAKPSRRGPHHHRPRSATVAHK